METKRNVKIILERRIQDKWGEFESTVGDACSLPEYKLKQEIDGKKKLVDWTKMRCGRIVVDRKCIVILFAVALGG